MDLSFCEFVPVVSLRIRVGAIEQFDFSVGGWCGPSQHADERFHMASKITAAHLSPNLIAARQNRYHIHFLKKLDQTA